MPRAHNLGVVVSILDFRLLVMADSDPKKHRWLNLSVGLSLRLHESIEGLRPEAIIIVLTANCVVLMM